MASEKSENTIKFLRLILLSSQTSLEVTKAFTQVNVLPQYQGSFDNFLSQNKHAIYHMWKNNSRCCVGNCDSIKTKSDISLSTRQFHVLFGLPDKPVPGHRIKDRQYCACGLSVNQSSMDKIDISLLCILIRRLCRLYDDEMLWLDTIRDIRNKLAHSEGVFEFDQGRLQKWWDKLEGSVLGLAGKIPPLQIYKTSVQNQISFLKISCVDASYATSILNQLEMENPKLQDTLVEQHQQTRKCQADHTETLQGSIDEVNYQMREMKDELVRLFDKNKAMLTVEIKNIVFEVVMDGIKKYFNEPKISRKDTEEVSSADTNAVDRQTDALGDRCRVEWKLQHPDSWKVDQISNALQGATQMLKNWFEVEFVYVGSIVVITSVSSLVFDDYQVLVSAIRSFLQGLVITCGIDTDKSQIINVDLKVLYEADIVRFKRDLTEKREEYKETFPESSTDERSIKNLDSYKGSVSENVETQEASMMQKERATVQLIEKTLPVKTDITLSEIHSFSLPTDGRILFICGCCIMESGSMIFTDVINQRLIHVDKNGMLCNYINLPFRPYGVEAVGDYTVAVTSWKKKTVVLVNITECRVEREIYEGEQCYGLCYSDGKLFVNVENKRIRVLSLDGTVLSTIEKVDNATYCCVDEKTLYYAVHNADTVYCCDMAGNVKWNYQCDEGDFPFEITVDNKENILVSCKQGNKVISIDKTGKESKVLLTEDDQANKQQAIAYNKIRNHLLVVNQETGKSSVYNII